MLISWESLVGVYLKLSLRGSRHNHHPHFRVWSFSRGDLVDRRQTSLNCEVAGLVSESRGLQLKHTIVLSIVLVV